MLFNVYDQNNKIIGEVEAENIIEAWSKAASIPRSGDDIILDVRQKDVNRRPFIGTCVENPFGDIHILDQVIGPDAEEITKREFLNNTQASAEEVASLSLRFFKSRDYFWRSKPNVYFYRDYLPPHEYAGVEHFFSWRKSK